MKLPIDKKRVQYCMHCYVGTYICMYVCLCVWATTWKPRVVHGNKCKYMQDYFLFAVNKCFLLRLHPQTS